jgi:hypothetical protein
MLHVVCIQPSLTLVLPYWLSSRLLIATPPYFPEYALQDAGFLSFLLGLFTREDGTDTLSRNVGKQLTTQRRVTSQKSADIINIAGEVWNQGNSCCPWQRLLAALLTPCAALLKAARGKEA